MNITKIYGILPPYFQNVIISSYGYYWKWRRFGGFFEKELNRFKENEGWSKEQFKIYQAKKLNKLLLHAHQNVPFYRNRLYPNNSPNFKLEANFKILEAIPILEKEDLRLYGKSTLMSKNRNPGHFYFSSGSTGTPTSIYYSYIFHQTWSALFEARIRHWAGLNNKLSRGMIGGRRILPAGNSKAPFYRYNLAEHQVYFSAYHIAPQNISNYVEGMIKYGIEYLTGYAESNYLLARMIKEEGLHAPKLKAVITSSEKLTQDMRSLFQEIYGCKSYDSYSGVEACGLISECEAGNLHISPEAGIIEILDNMGMPVKPGETGDAVCTGLLNFDQPLIRYRIGDRLTLSHNQDCICGRNMPIVSEINGRIEDVIKGIDGREMVRFHNVFTNLPEIIRGQIVQIALDKIIINVECSGQLSTFSKMTMIERVISQLGSVDVKIMQVKNIPISPNGKFKAVVSLLNK